MNLSKSNIIFYLFSICIFLVFSTDFYGQNVEEEVEDEQEDSEIVIEKETDSEDIEDQNIEGIPNLEDNPDELDELDESIEEIVITSRKIDQEKKEVNDAITVISRKEIEQSGAKTLDEILRNKSGLDLVQFGGATQDTRFITRGTNDSHTLVMLDGIPLNEIKTHRFRSLHTIPLRAIERVEYIRGNQTTLYGPMASGGVINIITQKTIRAKDEKKVNLIGEAFYGSHNFHDFGLGLKGQSNEYNFLVFGQYNGSDGFFKPRDGATDNSVVFSGGYQFDPFSKFNIVGFYSQRIMQYRDFVDTGHDSRRKRSQATFGMSYKTVFGDGFYEPILKVIYKNGNEYSNYARFSKGKKSISISSIQSDTFILSLQNNFYLLEGKNIFSIGLEYNRDEFFDSKVDHGKSRNAKTIYVMNQFRVISGLDFDASGRVDFTDSTYGWEDKTLFNFKVGLGYRFIDDRRSNFSFLRLRGNISNGKSLPTALQITRKKKDVGILEPEKVFMVDGGLDLYFLRDNIQMELTFFYTKVSDIIARNIEREYLNGAEVKSTGLEIETKVNLPIGFLLRGSYTYMDSKRKNFGKDIVTPQYLASHKFNVSLNWNYFDPWNINISSFYKGKRPGIFRRTYKDGPKMIKEDLPSHLILNVSTWYQIIPELKAIARLNNITDQYYEDYLKVPSDKFNWYIGLVFDISV